MSPTPLPLWAADFRVAAEPGEALFPYLERALVLLDTRLDGRLLQGAALAERFGPGELVVPSYRAKREVPPGLHPNLVLPLALALLLRQAMVAQGFGPLQVVAVYRPEGGARASAHKAAAAIDLKPPRLTRAACRALMVAAAWIWRTHAHLNVGVGTYGPYTDRTTLVHLDAGVRKTRKCWRHIKGRPVTPAVNNQPAAPWERRAEESRPM